MMVAVLLGIIVTGAVIGMYLSTSRNFSQDERYALMQENGRYALRILAEDLSMVDFWGKMIALDAIFGATAPTGDCATGTPTGGDGIDLLSDTSATTALLYNNNHAGGTSHFTPKAGCTAILDNQQANTDVLVVKRVEGVPETAQVDGVVYVRTNGVDGSYVDDADAGGPTNMPPAGFSDWRYMPRIYFVRDFFETAGDGIPSLCRLDLIDDTGPAMGKLTSPPNGTANTDANCIAEGIEDFHIQFGIDTDFDGVANQYKSSPTLAEMEAVVSARIFVLARSSNADPAHTDSKVFTLGDATVPADGNPFSDQFYRRVFSTTVMVRNTVNLNLLGG
jgi:type IV pilus assembly protein PilW